MAHRLIVVHVLVKLFASRTYIIYETRTTSSVRWRWPCVLSAKLSWTVLTIWITFDVLLQISFQGAYGYNGHFSLYYFLSLWLIRILPTFPSRNIARYRSEVISLASRWRRGWTGFRDRQSKSGERSMNRRSGLAHRFQGGSGASSDAEHVDGKERPVEGGGRVSVGGRCVGRRLGSSHFV